MDRQALQDIVRRLNDLERRSIKLRLGVITDTSPLSVALGGSDIAYTDVKRLESYASPVVDDLVAVLLFGNDLLVLGTVV